MIYQKPVAGVYMAENLSRSVYFIASEYMWKLSCARGSRGLLHTTLVFLRMNGISATDSCCFIILTQSNIYTTSFVYILHCFLGIFQTIHYKNICLNRGARPRYIFNRCAAAAAAAAASPLVYPGHTYILQQYSLRFLSHWTFCIHVCKAHKYLNICTYVYSKWNIYAMHHTDEFIIG